MRRIRLVEIVGNSEGGGTKCVARIVRHLDPARFDITLVAPSAPWLAELCRQHGATYCPLPLLSSRMSARLTAALSSILTPAERDVVSAHGTRAAWYALRAMRQLPTPPPLVYSEHLFSFDARQGILRWPWVTMEGYICRRAALVATGCEANARFVETRGWKQADEIAMRHYGIELEDFQEQAANRISKRALGLADDTPLIGTVGRLIPQKGLRYWLEAAAMVVRELPQAHFIIVGEGESRQALERQSERLGIARQVRFLGADPRPWRTLAACDVIAFSSLWEGLQQTAVEALAAGMPTVATRHQGTVEYIRPEWNGLLVPPRDARALASAILRVLDAPALRAQFVARGPESVTKYHTEIMIARFVAAYESLFTRRARMATSGALPARHEA